MKVVEIAWNDHSTTHGWARELASPMRVMQVGYLANETDEAYVLVDSEVQNEDGKLEVSKWGCSTDPQDRCDEVRGHSGQRIIAVVEQHIKRVNSVATYCGRHVLKAGGTSTVPILLMATKTPAEDICPECLASYTRSPEYDDLTEQLEAIKAAT